MATASWTAAPDNTNSGTYYKAYKPISDAMRAFGWLRTSDTGQMVWPSTIIAITNAVAATGVCTFTYTLTQGAVLRQGMSIKVTNCTTSGLNATYIIQSLPTGSTFTVNTATTVTEAETAVGGGDVQVSISNAIGNGSTNTYTYSALDGVLLPGMSVVITGCTTSGFNGTFTVGSINTGAGTFTTLTGISHATEAETGTGIVTSQSINTTKSATTLPPSGVLTIYEVWAMADALQTTMPVFVRIDYGGGPQLTFTCGPSTDGAGNINVVSTGLMNAQTNGNTNQSTTPAVNNYMSGSTNRMSILAFPGNGSAAGGGFFSIERSKDSNGNDTNSYVTGYSFAGANTASNSLTSQISFNTTSKTTAETKFDGNITTSTGTAAFGTSVGLCPLFPKVGAMGNPSLGLLLGKQLEWTDQTQFSLTLYGTAHNYIVSNHADWNGAGICTYNGTQTITVMMRYE